MPCGKRCYPSAQEAWKVVRRKLSRQRAGDRRRPSLSAYRCRRCGGWHLRTNTDHIERRRSWGWRKQHADDDRELPAAVLTGGTDGPKL